MVPESKIETLIGEALKIAEETERDGVPYDETEVSIRWAMADR
ncbi:hypothetical protein [Streptomyces panacea]